jgi:hypothetical protein
MTTRYLPHGMPINTHTCSSSAPASSRKPRGRSVRPSTCSARVEGINPADLTRQINAIQMQLLDLAQAKTQALAAARHVDLAALQPSIDRLAKAEQSRPPTRSHHVRHQPPLRAHF